ncbi:MAG TPA: class I SAM-dependent methyltransferase [bacterium]|nr:class I SAM-dependent methyltransferase [bacterium]HMW34905.1 class I SAM-dependent methyltransferase [bacterium]HMZ05173.1 class I SAM-dependent methyltransferase [bacterium]HNB10209.1 class I SAM-dependent methyltransferase [bacterium]HND76451.1 class I SAM-dependent methyltransferase [bacterium]
MSGSLRFETVLCPVCSHDQYSPWMQFNDKYAEHTLVRCTQCRFVYINPRPTEDTIGVYYSAEEYTPFVSSSDNRSLFAKVYHTVRRFSVRWKRKKVENKSNKGLVIDLGCGTAEFLNEMKQNGWQVAGIEPSPEASEFARSNYDIPVLTGTINRELIGQTPDNPDVITMWHVLEHVHRLDETLDLIYKKLKPGGTLVIAVPNINSLDALFYGRDWVALDVPRHLYDFVLADLRSLLNKHQFRVYRTHGMPIDAVFNVLMSEKNIIQRRGLWFLPLSLVRIPLVVSITTMAGLIRGRASAIVVYAEKQG